MNIMSSDSISNEKYNARCGFCHGADLNGIEGLGITLKNSDFLKNMTTNEIIAMISFVVMFLRKSEFFNVMPNPSMPFRSAP